MGKIDASILYFLFYFSNHFRCVASSQFSERLFDRDMTVLESGTFCDLVNKEKSISKANGIRSMPKSLDGPPCPLLSVTM